MKYFTIAFATFLLALPVVAQEKSPPPFKDLKDKVSYCIGLNIGFNFQKQKADINPDFIASGVKDALANKPAMSEQEVRETMTAFSKVMTDKQKEIGEKNKVESEKFLAENKKKPGIKTTASGLQYSVEAGKEGSGSPPSATDTVTVNYRGTLVDGTEFDSSYKRGQPATFPVAGVIKGWTEALQLMKKGSKYKLFIPPDLAYGERGAGGDIGPNQALIFEVELMDIKAGGAAGNPAGEKEGEKEKEKAKP